MSALGRPHSSSEAGISHPSTTTTRIDPRRSRHPESSRLRSRGGHCFRYLRSGRIPPSPECSSRVRMILSIARPPHFTRVYREPLPSRLMAIRMPATPPGTRAQNFDTSGCGECSQRRSWRGRGRMRDAGTSTAVGSTRPRRATGVAVAAPEAQRVARPGKARERFADSRRDHLSLPDASAKEAERTMILA